jgi:serine/threonine-protein kinase
VDLALKVSLKIADNEDVQNRFWREVETLKLLRHGHVLRIFDAGRSADGRFYLVMEYLEGLPLDRAHNMDHPMNPERALSVVRQACLGVAEAHARSIIHRDLKPSNIFLLSGDFVKVIDFGLARAYTGGGLLACRYTAPHVIAGTLHYMSPEQTLDKELTPSSDVYALGMILYELLTSRTPFHPGWKISEVRKTLKGRPMDWLNLHQNHPPLKFSQVLSPARPPSQLEQVVFKALEKDPARRYGTAAELAAALSEVGQALGPESRRDTGTSPAKRRIRGLAAGPRLVVLKPDDQMEVIPLRHGRILLGSGPSCHVHLPGQDVNDVHAALECNDLDRPPILTPAPESVVFVNGQPVRHAFELLPNQELQIGPTVLLLERQAWKL